MVPQVDRLELPMEWCQLKNIWWVLQVKRKKNHRQIILWTEPYLEEVQCLSGLKRLPTIWLIPLDRRSSQVHRLISLLVEVLLVAGVEMALAVSELLAKKEMIPHESTTLEEEEEAMLSFGVLLVTWYSWGLFSWLGQNGGHRHLSQSLLICQFADIVTKVS